MIIVGLISCLIWEALCTAFACPKWNITVLLLAVVQNKADGALCVNYQNAMLWLQNFDCNGQRTIIESLPSSLQLTLVQQSEIDKCYKSWKASHYNSLSDLTFLYQIHTFSSLLGGLWASPSYHWWLIYFYLVYFLPCITKEKSSTKMW